MNRPPSSTITLVVFAITCLCLFSPAAPGQIPRTSAEAAIPFIQEMVDAVSRDSLASYISALQAFGTRDEGTPQRDSAATYILNTFNKFGVTAESDWYIRNFNLIFDLDIVSRDSIWVVGTSSMIVATTDAGQTWNTQTSPISPYYRGVDFPDRFTGWAVGGGGSITHTTDAGEVWLQQTSGVTAILEDVDFVNERLGIAVGSTGVVLRTTNGGTDWTSVDCGTKARLSALKMLDSLHVWAVGDSGTIVHSTDGGIHWITQPSGVSASYSLQDIDFINCDIGWVVGYGTVIRKTTNGGQSWIKSPSPSQLWSCISFRDSLTGYGGTNSGDVLCTTDGGQSWRTLINVGYTLFAIKATSSGEIFAGGSRGLIARRNGDTIWINLTPNLPSQYLQTSRNIVATIAGQISPERECVIVAHYDSYSNSPGANDNASGTSAVMEAARLCREYRFSSTVKFLAVSAEELGLLGSREYADRARRSGTAIHGVVNGDMIGYPVTGDTARLAIGSYRTRNRLIDSALAFNSRYGIGLTLRTFTAYSGSDYCSFGMAGYDAVSVQEGTHDEIQGGGDPYYHHSSDTIDKLTLGLVRRGAQLMLATVAELAVPLERVSSVPPTGPWPELYVLCQNYPNPFNPSTTIKYMLPKSSEVRLSVFDMLGRKVSVLVDEKREAGFHEVKFDAVGLSSGVYFYRLRAGEFVETKRMLVLK